MSGKVIDLLSSDSEDEGMNCLTEASALASHREKPNSCPPVVSQSQQGECCDSDDSLMNSEPVFLNKKPAAKTSNLLTSSATSSVAVKVTKTPPNSPNQQTTPMNNSAARLKPPSQMPPQEEDDSPFQFPALLSTTTQYNDVRAEYILSFWQSARTCVRHSYNGKKLDQLIRKVVLLSLTPFPIRSLEEYCFSRGVGGCAGGSDSHKTLRLTDIRSLLQQGGLGTREIRPEPVGETTRTTRRYFSVGEACLVALLTKIENRLAQKDIDPRVLNVMDDLTLQEVLSDKDLWVSLQDLIPAVDNLLRPECPGRLTIVGAQDNGAAHYIESSTRSAEFLQIRKLETCHKELGDNNVARIKRHRRGGSVLFELTFVGVRSAIMIRERQFPLEPGHYRCSRILRISQVPDAYKDICIGVDLREGGGGTKALHEMCNRLETTNVPYFVAPLKVGDYMFFTRDPSRNLEYLCPILVERKAVEDIARSIHDGRWNSQKKRMYQGQYVFGYDNCRMVYMIEGNLKSQQVTGGYIGSFDYGLHTQDIEREIASLESEGFEVLRTTGRDQSMLDLARWVKNVVLPDLKSGKLTAQYTYAQFIDELKKIPPSTDYSRLAKSAMERTVQASVAAAASKRAHTEVDYDSEIEVLEEMSSRENPTGRRSLHDNLKPAAKPSKPAAKKTKGCSEEFTSMSKKQLEEKCVEYGLPKSGTKPDLISRLQGPRPPKLLVRRKQSGEYVPSKHDGASAALLVALYLHEKDTGPEGRGLTKDELIAKADELQIMRTPILASRPGPYAYTGWDSMSRSLVKGDPALVKVMKSKYKLTRNSELSGYPFAKAIHRWCHEWNACRCGGLMDTDE